MTHFDAAYHEEIELDDGTRVRLRLIRPTDKERLVRGLARLSPASRYRRFLTDKDHFSPEELRYLTECDGTNHLAIGAALVGPEEEGADEGIGVARFVRDPQHPEVAEAAVAVIDDYQGHGLGRLLCRRLVEAARERGIERFACEMMPGNEPVQALVHALAQDVKAFPGEDEVSLEIPLVPPAAEAPHGRGPVEQLLAMVARGLVRVRSVFTRHSEALAAAAGQTPSS
ncbi:MAG TPA: GNAT family N-acetyltransferase [Polyangia bacterium]|jgi:GNAT superfamily N-acetyltransferase|nr:GNAT family N-acetyltransferase [Polyangia bacterium]